jgi:hypothetical protein
MTSKPKPSKTSHLLDPVGTPATSKRHALDAAPPASTTSAPAAPTPPAALSDSLAPVAAAAYTHPAALNGHDDGVVKHFVIDTNVLLHNPNALFVFN